MANRGFNRRQSLEKEVKDLYCKISIGATGAPTLVSGASYGFSSVARTDAGEYTLTLQDKYVSLKFVEGIFLSETPEDIRLQLVSESVQTDREINFLTLTADTPTDPSSGQVLLLKVEVKNTSVV